MNDSQKNIIKEWVTDIDPKYLSNAQAFYIKNLELINEIGNKNTPLNANHKACDIIYPIGDNYRIGSHYAVKTNECYIWVYNTNSVHFIYRVTEDKGCEIVYDGCLNISAEPANDITQFRAVLLVDKTCKNWAGKRLVWADGNGIYCLDVEASIATDSFTTPIFKTCNADPCDYINLCVPSPCDCPKAKFVPTPLSELGLNNKMVDVGFQFAYRYHNYDRTVSRISNPSTYYYQSSKTGCFEENVTARCMEVTLPIGNAKVEFIELLYRTDNSNNWLSAKMIPRYKKYNSAQEQWYERQLSEEVSRNFNPNNCTFDYLFCNDDFCQAVDVNGVKSNYDRFPRKPQGLFLYGDNGLAVYNYLKGNCPIDKIEQEKFKVNLICSDANNCTTEFVDVTVRAIIHNFEHGRNQFIWRNGGSGAALTDDITDIAFFGGINPALSGGVEDGYGQRFYGEKRNFIVYVEGTDYYGDMKQYKSKAFFVGREEWGVVGDMDDVNTRNRWRRATRNGEFFYQEATIKVPKGTKGFLRLDSHKVTSHNPNTSTTVIGTQNISVYKGDLDTSEGFTDGVEEIYFDTCGITTGKLDLGTAFMIDDTAVDVGLTNKVSAFCGYVKDCNQNPIEGARVKVAGIDVFTDHNGFYHTWKNTGNDNDVTVEVFVEKSATGLFTSVYSSSMASNRGSTSEKDITVEDAEFCNDKYFGLVKAKVVDCDGNPIKGVRVAVSGSKYGVTNSLGETNIKVRNYENRNRSIRAVVMDNSSCFTIDCNDNCNPCMQDFTATPLSTYQSKPIFNIGTATINTNGLLNSGNGLKKGGKYQFGFQLQGDCGNFSFAYANNKDFISIPKNSGSKFSYCSFEYDLTGIVLPNWVNCLNIVRTKNLNPFELQWIVDKVENINGKVKLTIQSLNDYNFNAGFKTNTIYQYLEDDRLEIISDDKGVYFGNSLNYKILNPFHDKVVSGKTDAPADYFNQLLIEDDGRVQIKKGFIIEMQRPKECSSEHEFYTICSSIPVVNGQVLIPKGVFNTFDTYYIKRKFADNINKLVEHHSPSDYWGNRISDIGIVHITNQFEDEKRYGRNITVATSGDISDFNFFEKTFDNSEQGDIVAMGITDDDAILGICEFDNFIIQKAKNLLETTASGNIQVISSENIFSDPQTKLIGKFGCRYEDIGSIFFGDGYATWIDASSNAYIMHNYSNATDVSDEKIKKWCYDKIQYLLNWNKAQVNPLSKYRFNTGINSINGVVMLTVKRLYDSGIDSALEPNISIAETIGFNPSKSNFVGNYGFLAEGYSSIDLLDGSGCKFITFLNGDAYIHPIIATKWNEFYGVAVDSVFGIALNKYPEKIKRGLSGEIQSKLMWFLHKVETEQSNFVSEVPPAMIEKVEDKYNFHFLCNKNGHGGIYGNVKNIQGEHTRGYYIKCIFVRDNTDALKYKTINPSKQTLYDELDIVFFKFLNSEQSGFSENI